MQTFLPFSSFEKSLQSLDVRRLGNQRKETKQIIDTITQNKKAWSNHPCVNMWRGYVNALKLYYNTNLIQWELMGYKNIKLKPFDIIGDIIMPEWLGRKDFHISHQSNLIRKKPEYYQNKFPGIPDNLPYIWPVTN